ncbi:thioredoxin-like fold domain-containing protein MRL7, chloroplastic [Vitis riparia]|uniref:thioredoxin-like fold domain-containing protein MRL7, chloroplastic n=1 Tax=Vitis riparia TaxID=96939 RepID=UPI00155A43F3|nr:thioredoxin-like fold domain-containing protein MRL7, chloroplastic [Vitis riparia]
MLPIQTTLLPKSFSPLFHSKLVFSSTLHSPKPPSRVVVSARSDPKPNPKPRPEPGSKPKRRTRAPRNDGDEANPNRTFPATIPRKPRRGRRSEAVAVEDFVRDTLDRTFAAIREQNSETPEIMKKRLDDDDDDDEDDEEDEDNGGDEVVVEEESSNWPLDAEVGWGIRASEYFEQHPIKNVVGEDGVEIDWEGELETGWVKEINCLEWESFAFHPSPLIVLVFERYNRASDNWKVLKELEKAAKVYWSAKDRLPPRTVKIDINIERDMAYALQAKECPQILFLRGNRILYREKDFRTADELVHMIAYFYYNAKKPSCISDSALFSR